MGERVVDVVTRFSRGRPESEVVRSGVHLDERTLADNDIEEEKRQDEGTDDRGKL